MSSRGVALPPYPPTDNPGRAALSLVRPGIPAQVLDEFVQSPSEGWTLHATPRAAAMDALLREIPVRPQETPTGRQRHQLAMLRGLLAAQAETGRDVTYGGLDALRDLLVDIRRSRTAMGW